MLGSIVRLLGMNLSPLCEMATARILANSHAHSVCWPGQGNGQSWRTKLPRILHNGMHTGLQNVLCKIRLMHGQACAEAHTCCRLSIWIPDGFDWCHCRNHGCNLASCVLCKHNPAKRCTGNFAHKYWVGDKLLAKCEGSIVVEVIDADSGERMVDEVQGMRIEVRRCFLLTMPNSSFHSQNPDQSPHEMVNMASVWWTRCRAGASSQLFFCPPEPEQVHHIISSHLHLLV